MTLQMTKETAYAQGRAAGQAVAADPEAAARRMENGFRWARIQYPAIGDLNLSEEVLALDRRRMAWDLDLTRFPECRGLRELVEAEQKGFADACPDPLQWAMHNSWGWFISRILNTRYVGRTPPPAQCTDFWFAHTREGGPIHGCNRDDVRENYTSFPTPTGGGRDERFTKVTQVGGVSSSVLCDEEPEDWFPVKLGWIMPPDIRTVKDHLHFLERYRDFWGPANQIYVDPDLTFAAVEKANRRMGVRYSTDGSCAITACAYLIPEMAAFKKERDAVSLKARGWTEDSPDFKYWEGCERRYRRLLKLVDEENRRGATLLGAARIALDHAVPFPDRICVAGERGHPDEALQNWSLQSFVRCISGPNRRTIYWHMDPTRPIPVYQTKPFYLLGEGVAMRPEWERELAEAGDIGGPTVK
jgi:hypothetical protein